MPDAIEARRLASVPRFERIPLFPEEVQRGVKQVTEAVAGGVLAYPGSHLEAMDSGLSMDC